MSLPRPTDVAVLSDLSAQLDNSTPAERLAWAYTLDEVQQLALFDLAKGNQLLVDDVVHDGEQVFIHPGRNGLPLFNRFEKRFARLGGKVVGYNENPSRLMAKIVGPGHYQAYAAPDGDGIWIDYRQIPDAQHPAFPPLIDNDHGIRALVFGNMVDVLRRASQHVLIGNAYKNKSPARTLLSRIGSRLPTAPFVLVQPN